VGRRLAKSGDVELTGSFPQDSINALYGLENAEELMPDKSSKVLPASEDNG